MSRGRKGEKTDHLERLARRTCPSKYPKKTAIQLIPLPLLSTPPIFFSIPEKSKKGRYEGISVLATLHTLNNNNRQLNTNISIVKETTFSRKSARIAHISSSIGRMPRYSPISSPSVASSSSASSPPRLNSPIPPSEDQSSSSLSPSPDVPPIPRSPNILPIPSPLTGLCLTTPVYKSGRQRSQEEKKKNTQKDRESLVDAGSTIMQQ